MLIMTHNQSTHDDHEMGSFYNIFLVFQLSNWLYTKSEPLKTALRLSNIKQFSHFDAFLYFQNSKAENLVFETKMNS